MAVMNVRVLLAALGGLLFGAVGAVLFMDSAPPEKGSPEARADKLQSELTRAQSRIALLESQVPKQELSLGDHARAGMARILDDLKHGRPVNAEEVYQQMKPLMRDLAPVFDHLRRKAQRQEFARLAAHMAEAYQLTEPQQQALEQWLGERAIKEAEAFHALAYGDNATFETLIAATRYQRPKAALDEFMLNTLKGPERERYRTDRLRERASSIESHANSRVDLLDAAVQLDTAQEDRLFSLFARSSPEYDPAMQIGNITADGGQLSPGVSRQQAIMNLLRPDQRVKFEAYRQRQRAEAEREAAEMGLKLPPNWDFFDLEF
jgi:hypothetical protein